MNPIVSRTQITLRSVQSTKSMSCKIEKEDYWSKFKSTKIVTLTCKLLVRFEDDSNDPIDLQLYQSHLNAQMNVEELPFRSHFLKVLHSTEIDTHN